MSRVTRDEVRGAIRAGKLTTDEEKVLRMRHGAGEDDSHELEFRGQDNDLTRIRLAQMEREILRRTRGTRPNPRKDRVVQALKDMS